MNKTRVGLLLLWNQEVKELIAEHSEVLKELEQGIFLNLKSLVLSGKMRMFNDEKDQVAKELADVKDQLK